MVHPVIEACAQGKMATLVGRVYTFTYESSTLCGEIRQISGSERSLDIPLQHPICVLETENFRVEARTIRFSEGRWCFVTYRYYSDGSTSEYLSLRGEFTLL